jgi:hypothetical protein
VGITIDPKGRVEHDVQAQGQFDHKRRVPIHRAHGAFVHTALKTAYMMSEMPAIMRSECSRSDLVRDLNLVLLVAISSAAVLTRAYTITKMSSHPSPVMPGIGTLRRVVRGVHHCPLILKKKSCRELMDKEEDPRLGKSLAKAPWYFWIFPAVMFILILVFLFGDKFKKATTTTTTGFSGQAW